MFFGAILVHVRTGACSAFWKVSTVAAVVKLPDTYSRLFNLRICVCSTVGMRFAGGHCSKAIACTLTSRMKGGVSISRTSMSKGL